MPMHPCWTRPTLGLTLGLALLTGCVAEESDPADSGCYAELNATRDGAPRDCYVAEPDAEPSPLGRGIAFHLVDDADTRLDELTLSAGLGASVGAWLGGYGADGIGCPADFSATVVPDADTENQLNLRTWFDYDPNRACGGGRTTARVTVDLPALSSGQYVLRLRNGGCPDRDCLEPDPNQRFQDVPVNVVP